MSNLPTYPSCRFLPCTYGACVCLQPKAGAEHCVEASNPGQELQQKLLVRTTKDSYLICGINAFGSGYGFQKFGLLLKNRGNSLQLP